MSTGNFITIEQVVAEFKKQTAQREAFLLNEILPKMKWYHKVLFRINNRFIKHLITQVVCGNQWGAMLYGKIYWMPNDYFQSDKK